MEAPLSILLPVRNCQSTLSRTAEQILEVVGELNRRFELVIIDDGSTDATIEVADELAARYPQVSAVRHSAPLGRTAAIHTGLRRSRGQVVLWEEAQGLAPSQLQSLLPAARATSRVADASLAEKRHGASEPAATPRAASSRPKRPNYLDKLRDLALGE